MEQNINTTAPIISETEQKNENGSRAVIAIISIMAICGVGFGIYGVVQSAQKDNQVSDLKAQVENYNREISTLKSGGLELTDVDDEVVIDADSEAGDVDAEDYIYIGEWGLKIKMPAELKMASYEFQHYKYSGQDDRTSVSIAGTTTDVDVLPDFGNIRKCGGLGAIGRVEKGAGAFGSSLVFSDDDYDYYYSHPQSVCSVDQSEQELEKAAVDLIGQMLQDANNYSTM